LADQPLPLVGPQAAESNDPPAPKSGNPVIKTFGSLVLVIGVFAAIVFWMRRVGGRGGQPLPKEVWEVLGRGPLDNKHYVQLVKLGDRLLLVGISNNGSRTLTEVTDPEEVRQLSSACRRNGSGLAARWPSGLAAKVTGRRVKSAKSSGGPVLEKELDPAYLGSGHV
jgi:flagellar biogenesis protein FliO